jgi:hypothetical protein
MMEIPQGVAIVAQINEMKDVQRPEVHLSLAERDKYLSQIEGQITSKRKLLLKKRDYLNKSLKENTFLEGVKNATWEAD